MFHGYDHVLVLCALPQSLSVSWGNRLCFCARSLFPKMETHATLAICRSLVEFIPLSVPANKSNTGNRYLVVLTPDECEELLCRDPENSIRFFVGSTNIAASSLV